jgi:RHS repeat-associated protein
MIRNYNHMFGSDTTNSWTRENTTGNNFLGNGGTELNPTSKVYDLAFRNYDPALGRMNGVDPMASKYASLTPYNYSFNDPVSFNDPSGAEPPQTINYGARSSNWYTSYTYDDRVDYHRGGEFYYGSSSALRFHTGGRGGGLGGIISSWAPDFYGPVTYVDGNGDTRNTAPSMLISAVQSAYGLDITNSYELFNPWLGETDGKGTYQGAWDMFNVGALNAIVRHGYRVELRMVQQTQNGSCPKCPNTPAATGDLPWRDVATAELTIWGAAFTIAEHNSKPLYQGLKSWMAEAKLAGRTGIKLGLLGLGITAIDVLKNGPRTSSALDGIFGTVVTFGGAPGAIVGGIYFAINFGTTAMTGKSLGQHVDDHFIIVPGPMPGVPIFIKR